MGAGPDIRSLRAPVTTRNRAPQGGKCERFKEAQARYCPDRSATGIYGLDQAIACIELLAKHGARWAPTERSRLNHLRKALFKIDRYKAINVIENLLAADAFETAVFPTLVATPKMKDYLRATRFDRLQVGRFAPNKPLKAGTEILFITVPPGNDKVPVDTTPEVEAWFREPIKE
jgi:hypothetical protein